MNFKTAGFVAGGAFLLSFVSALLGGVGFGDVLIRAVFWAAVAGGLTLAAEFFLRMQLPELFQGGVSTAAPAPQDQEEAGVMGSKVDISLEEEGRGGFVQEMEESQEEGEVSRGEALSEPPSPDSERTAVSESEPSEASEGGADEPLPEIGSFLDSFRPQVEGEESPQGEEPAEESPYGGAEEFSPGAPASKTSVQENWMDGEEQDPAVLAKAVQTIMKKGQ